MPKVSGNNIPFGSATLINILLIASITQVRESPASINEDLYPYSASFSGRDEDDKDGMVQASFVSPLLEVQLTDWVFQAWQSLTENYRYIRVYSDLRHWEDRVFTRYEFAARLNTRLEKIHESIALAGEGVTEDDLTTMRRLEDEFAAELGILRRGVDSLEAGTTRLEAPHFTGGFRF
ncbi:iron uptake porin [Argonema galeatum]|uniref:iron uptake porin n=1 Tax=Argonema galeatum TaxID=2942762 RepID=UPI0020114711|nr:iron uptake porin [Argonema galeatum]MCL1465250.1 iron uptake porin [Argonema galeatum A003/A1]